MARIPTRLMKLVTEALVTGRQDSVLDEGDALLPSEVASHIWQHWTQHSSEEQRQSEIEALAQARWEELQQAAEPLLQDLAADNPNVYQTAAAYLLQIPAAIRRRLRRPADAEGHTLPSGWSLRQADDLSALLPQQLPWFTPGDRPSDVGNWELVELIDVGGLGETWKARNPDSPDGTPVLLKFCLHPTAKERLLRPETLASGSILDRVMQQGEHPGLLRLRRLHLHANPPCLEYEHFAGAPLVSLARDRQLPQPPVVLQIMRDLAQTLGRLHRLEPPLVHRGLGPETVLVRQNEDGSLTCKLTDLGLSAFLPRPADRFAADMGRNPVLYQSPQEQRGEPPQARDDIFSLGILWYQLLIGNFSAGRPGGSQWRRRLADQGLATEVIELLETCFEDDPMFRPADGADLADKLQRLTGAAARPAARKRVAMDDLLAATTAEAAPPEPAEPAGEARPAGRSRSRRSDVWQLFDTLEKKAPELPKLITNSLGLKLVLVPAGSFQMGTQHEEIGARENEWPRHEITLTQPFYLGVTPITQQQYARVMGQNPARFHADNGGGPDHPVENVTWEQAVDFCRRLSELPEEKQAGRSYRLPTEAEWEYACRAGTDTPFSYGSALSSAQANCDGQFPYGGAPAGRAAQKTTRVGQFAPNNFGLCDMHGNVWEWCADWLEARYYEWSPRRDPAGPGEGRFRVLRGGSWKNHAVTCRAGYRNGLNPRLKDSATGFRVVCAAGTPPAA